MRSASDQRNCLTYGWSKILANQYFLEMLIKAFLSGVQKIRQANSSFDVNVSQKKDNGTFYSLIDGSTAWSLDDQ